MLRVAGFTVLAVIAGAALASPVPPSSDFEITTPTHDYIVHVDNDPTSPHYYPVLKGLADAFALDRTGDFDVGNPLGYHHGYSQLGFLGSYFAGGVRNVYYWDCNDGEDFDCDYGLASSDAIHMPSPSYIDDPAICTRVIVGHELFHQVQNAYEIDEDVPSMPSWVTEGQARAMQDKIYLDADLDPSTACNADYISQVDAYLDDPNRTIWTVSYSAALFWQYLMEQFGDNDVEPTRGADFVAEWWARTLLPDPPTGSVDLTDAAIAAADPGEDFRSAFRSFAIANLVKDFDLSNVSAAFHDRYSYRDEDPVDGADQDFYTTVAMPAAKVVDDVTDEQSFVFGSEHYGAQYWHFETDGCSNGSTLKLSFEPASNDPFFGLPLHTLGAWAAEFTRGATPRPVYHYRKIDEDWSVSVVQPFNRIDDVYAVTTGLDGPILGAVRLECLPPPPQPELPLLNPIRPQTPGPTGVLTYGEVHVDFDDRDPGIAGTLDASQFAVTVGGKPARVLAAVPDRGGHTLALEYPVQTSPGPFALRVAVGDVNAEVAGAVLHTGETRQVTIVQDLSVSMALRAPAARRALALLVDSLADGTRAALVTYAGDSIEPNQDATVRVPLATLDASQRTALQGAIAALVPSTSHPRTAVTDGVQLALAEFAARGVPFGSRDVVVLCDGAEDPAQFATLLTAARAQGATVHTIALGPHSDQGMLARLANETGGAYHYVADGAAGGLAALRLALRDVADRVEGRVVAFERRVPIGPNLDLAIDIPSTTTALLLPAVQKAIATAALESGSDLPLEEVSFNYGRISTTGAELPVAGLVRRDGPGHTAFHDPALQPAAYRLRIKTGPNTHPDAVVVQFAAATRGVGLVTGIARPGDAINRNGAFRVGEAVGVQVAAYGGYTGGVLVSSGDINVQPPGVEGYTVALEPAESADGRQIWLEVQSHGLVFQDTSRGSPTNIADDGSFAGAEGSYVLTFTTHAARPDGANARLVTRRSFAVTRPTVVPDGDADGLPDAHEIARPCLDPDLPNPTSQDRDGDTLPNVAEYQQGLDPCDTDTDGGGEDDASELAFDGDPHDRRDDRIRPRAFFIVDRSPVDHDGETPLPPRALRLVFDRDAGHALVEIYGGTAASGHIKVFSSDPLFPPQSAKHAGDLESFVHTNLVAGEQYCYFMRAFDAAGRSAARTPIVCAVAREDSNVPWGDIALARGRPRTDDARVRAELSLYNEDKATSEMSLAFDGAPGRTWQPYAASIDLDLPSVSVPRRLTVAVQYRDAAGNLSPVYRDAVMVHPRGSLGGVAGVVRFDASMPKGGALAQGVYIAFADSEREAVTTTDANGAFALAELEPGPHMLRIAHPGMAPRDMPVMIVAGQTTTMGEILLGSGDPVFADGFE